MIKQYFQQKLIPIKVLNYKALFDSYISHDEFISANDVLKQYDKMNKGIKKFEDLNSQLNILIYL